MKDPVHDQSVSFSCVQQEMSWTRVKDPVRVRFVRSFKIAKSCVQQENKNMDSGERPCARSILCVKQNKICSIENIVSLRGNAITVLCPLRCSAGLMYFRNIFFVKGFFLNSKERGM